MPTAKGVPAKLVSRGVCLTVTLPVKTGGSLNSREHWAARHRRVKAERADAGLWLVVLAGRHPPPGLASAARVSVRLTRLGGRRMDAHDNLPSALKAVADTVTDWLGLASDADPRVIWSYGQEPGSLSGVRVEIEAEGKS